MTRYLPLFATLLLVVLLYSRESTSYFCGFDDLNEWHRVAFTEHPGLADDFTTHPYLGYKYRPLSWTIDRLTYEAGHGNPAFYRIRNVGFHLLNVILIYAIAIFLFEPPWVAGTAALLFGIHPLANQSIAGAVWTITPAAFLLLLALYLFLLATRKNVGVACLVDVIDADRLVGRFDVRCGVLLLWLDLFVCGRPISGQEKAARAALSCELNRSHRHLPFSFISGCARTSCRRARRTQFRSPRRSRIP